jgi:Nucleotidyltransferase domain
MRSRRSSRSSTAAAAAAKEASGFAEMLARSCSEALGGIVAGVILHGSLTFDDYLPGRSDVDLLFVAQDPLRDAQLAALAALTEALAGRRPRAPPMEAYLFGPSWSRAAANRPGSVTAKPWPKQASCGRSSARRRAERRFCW